MEDFEVNLTVDTAACSRRCHHFCDPKLKGQVLAAIALYDAQEAGCLEPSGGLEMEAELFCYGPPAPTDPDNVSCQGLLNVSVTNDGEAVYEGTVIAIEQ